MKPYLIDSWGTQSNRLLAALSQYVHTLLVSQSDLVDSPAGFEDQVNEWLGQHGPAYKKCRWESVVTLIRDFQPLNWPSRRCPCLRIYYEGQDGLSMFLVFAIGFVETITTEPDKAHNPLLPASKENLKHP